MYKRILKRKDYSNLFVILVIVIGIFCIWTFVVFRLVIFIVWRLGIDVSWVVFKVIGVLVIVIGVIWVRVVLLFEDIGVMVNCWDNLVFWICRFERFWIFWICIVC